MTLEAIGDGCENHFEMIWLEDGNAVAIKGWRWSAAVLSLAAIFKQKAQLLVRGPKCENHSPKTFGYDFLHTFVVMSG